jgi:hypothetical protein
MATSVDRNKPLQRPKKSLTAARKRRKLHEKRLVKLGLDPVAVTKLNSKQIRTLIRHPVKTAAQAAKAAAKKK